METKAMAKSFLNRAQLAMIIMRINIKKSRLYFLPPCNNNNDSRYAKVYKKTTFEPESFC